MSIRPQLSTSGLARLMGVTDRTVRRRIAAGEFPTSTYTVSPGGRYRLLTARLIAAGLLTQDAQLVQP